MKNLLDNFDQRKEFGNIDSNLRFLQETNQISYQTKILEIGSGNGSLLNYLYRRGYDILGIEINESRLEESKNIYGDLPLNIVKSEKLPFPDNYFDVVISFDVFEHILDSDKHLQEVRRVLKNKGFYLLQTPNKWTNVIFETIRWKSFTKWQKEHCSLHNYWEIISRFNKNGFEVVFYDIPVVNDFFILKINTYLGKLGVYLLKIINPDRLPIFLKTNFYLKASKNKSN